MKKYNWHILLSLLLIIFSLIAVSCITVHPPQSDGQRSSSGGGDLPVINAFSASSININQGDSATLSWQVTGANTVTIDNGIGSVSLSGSRGVQPETTTIYTLTATGPGGNNTATVQVTVSSSASSGSDTYTIPSYAQNTQPEGTIALPVINSFTASKVSDSTASYILSWSVSNASSVSITPGIGTVSAVGSMTVTPSSSTTYTLSAKNINGARMKTVTVSAVVGVEHINWRDEQIVYDFIERAPSARWVSGDPPQELAFPGSNNASGFVCYQLNTKLSDGVTYSKLLETHPKYINYGYIGGAYKNIYIPAGAKFKVKVGIIKGATSGKVLFSVGSCCPKGSRWLYEVVAYADGVISREWDLSAYAGKTLDSVTLQVTAEGVSTQDWAAWAEAKIVH